jgi:hypothetical protein
MEAQKLKLETMIEETNSEFDGSEPGQKKVFTLPAIESSLDLSANPPELRPVLIDGILRKGHKMSLSAPSKAGKSFALINLALSFAHGAEWLGFPCKPCRCLYVNFEIDRASCWQRFETVAQAREINAGHENLKIWNLRGYNAPIEDLIPALILDIGANQYEAVIIDPLYKMYQSTRVRTFDENSAASLSYLFCEFDRLIRECDCALIMAGHYSKGMQGAKSSIDRTSGSGVLGRDPDAILSMTELEATEGGYRLESVLRDFPSTVNLSLRWEYPLHIVDPMLDCEALKGGAGRKQAFNGGALLDAFQKLDTGAGVPVEKMLEALGVKAVNTLKARIADLEASGMNNIGLHVQGNKVLSTIKNCQK